MRSRLILAFVALVTLSCVCIRAADGGGKRMAILSDHVTSLDPALVVHVSSVLKDAGVSVTPLTCNELCDARAFNAGRFDALVLTASPLFPVAAEKALLGFLHAGGDLVLMGGHAFHEPLWKHDGRWLTRAEVQALPQGAARPEGFTPDKEFGFYAAFEDYEVYRLENVMAIQPAPQQSWFLWRFTLAGQFEGVSAVGFGFPKESVFVPLLSAVDRYGRTRGWAGGLHINYGGQFKNSKWALFGITTPSFYRSAEFARVLADVLGRFKSNELEQWAESENRKALVHTVQVPKTPPPTARINKSRRCFERADGRPLFLIGCNYLGNLRLKYGADNAAEVEADFQRMQRAGINAIRLYSMNRFLDERGAALLKACARKYGIYFMPVVVDHPDCGNEAELKAHAQKVARLFKGEPMLLGYDLTNEPYFWELGKMKTASGKTLWELNPQPPHGWKIYEAAIGLDLKSSAFPGVSGKLPVPADAGQRQTFDSVNRIYGTFIGWLRDAIREVDANVPITVGYNTVWSCMPANEPLEFVAAHFYAPPENLDGVRRNLTTLDRLRSVWPDRPIFGGEFGYSGGDVVGGKPLDVHTIAVGEFMHYLYALAHGYAGAFKWCLDDFSIWNDWRQMKWIPWEKRAEHVRQARFGLFYDDGTPEGGAKPLVAALRFLRDYVDAGNLGGKIEVRPAQTPIGTGYVFEGTNALFIGDVAYQSPRLAFNAARPANVLLWWSDNNLRLLSTADATVRLDVNALAPRIELKHLRLDGQHGNTDVDKNFLAFDALEGETVTIR